MAAAKVTAASYPFPTSLRSPWLRASLPLSPPGQRTKPPQRQAWASAGCLQAAELPAFRPGFRGKPFTATTPPHGWCPGLTDHPSVVV